MVSPSGGKATAKAIPGARLMTIEGMGHDLPEAAWPQLVPAIADHAHAADRARRRRAAQRVLSNASRTRLRDGSSVVIRPIAPEDRELLRAGFERLSERSRYLRFQTPLVELSDEQLSYLTDVDHHDHEALLAVDPERDDAVGVARFVRVGDGVAECAIVVADDWQNRGLGGQLLERLVERAREEDVERFTALVLAENTDARRLLERLGNTVRRSGKAHRSSSRSSFRSRAESSASLRLILAGAARGLLIPAISMWRQVADFTHRRAEPAAEPANVIVAHAYGAAGDAPVLAVAAGLAAYREAHIHLVESYWPVLSNRSEADQRLSAAAAELRRQGFDVTAHLLGGDTADAVIDVAEQTEAALIVIDPRAQLGHALERVLAARPRVCSRPVRRADRARRRLNRAGPSKSPGPVPKFSLRSRYAAALRPSSSAVAARRRRPCSSSWRARSAVIPSSEPAWRRVRGSSPARPNRKRITLASAAGNRSTASLTRWSRSRSATSSMGSGRSLASKSPSAVSPSSLTG